MSWLNSKDCNKCGQANYARKTACASCDASFKQGRPQKFTANHRVCTQHGMAQTKKQAVMLVTANVVEGHQGLDLMIPFSYLLIGIIQRRS